MPVITIISFTPRNHANSMVICIKSIHINNLNLEKKFMKCFYLFSQIQAYFTFYIFFVCIIKFYLYTLTYVGGIRFSPINAQILAYMSMSVLKGSSPKELLAKFGALPLVSMKFLIFSAICLYSDS